MTPEQVIDMMVSTFGQFFKPKDAGAITLCRVPGGLLLASTHGQHVLITVENVDFRPS